MSGTTSGGSSGVSATVTPGSVNLRNNIIYNGLNAGGTSLAVGFRRAAATFTAFASTSNNNLYFTGGTATTPVYYDGTAAQATLAAYKVLAGLAPREQASVFENATFASTTGSASTFLHFTAGASTAAESGAATISGVTTDFDGDTRGTTPDIGADEFAGTQVQPAITAISASPSGIACTATARTITVTTVDGALPVTGVNLTYAYNGGTPTTVAMTGGPTSWTGTIPAATTPVNATVTYSAVATDGVYTPSITGTSYADEPMLGATATASATPNPVCLGQSVTLSSAASKPGNAVLGAGATTSSSTAASFLPGAWGGTKTQYIIKASELAAIGVSAGPITAISYEPTTSGQTYTGFSVSLASTSLTAMTTAFVTTGLTQVYLGTGVNDAITPVANTVNTFTFGTGAGSSSSWTWDGVSNILVSVSWSSVPAATTATGSTMKVDAPGFTCSAYRQADSETPATMLASATATSTGTSRPRFTFAANTAPTVTFSWSDGTSTVGTGASVSVTPTATTTYTAIATDANGCSITASVVVNTNPLPAAPTAVNSTQCGTAIPGCAVTGSGGLFRWYLASTGGSPLSGESQDHLTAYTISSTTTFYVSEFDGSCESLRTEVIAEVTSPIAVTATSTVSTTCPFINFTLDATSTNDPNYAYSWTGSSANSGITTPLTGASQTIQATAGGVYTYTVNANDAGSGCATTAQVVVTVTTPPTISSITAVPSTICAGESVVLTAQTPIIAAGDVTVGTGVLQNGTSTTTNMPPYGNYYTGNRHQMIVLASELSASGMYAGNITSLGFDVVSNTNALGYGNFTISMKNTASTTASLTFETGATQVYTVGNFNPTAGWTSHSFSTPFFWNGTSNVLIDITFSDCPSCVGPASTTCNTTGSGVSYTQNAVVNNTTTAFTSHSYYYSDAAGCNPQLVTAATT